MPFYRLAAQIIVILAGLSLMAPVSAGSLLDADVTPADTTAGAVSSYTINFRPETSIGSGDFIILRTESYGTPGANLENATLGSISGGGLTGTNSFKTSNRWVVWLNGGSANSTTTVTVVVNGVVNPAVPGQGPDYKLDTTDGGSTIDFARITGTVYTPNTQPAVLAPIPDQELNAEDNPITVVADLTTVFVDGDGDPLTFSVDAGHDTNVLDAQVSGNQLLISGNAYGTTAVTVRADDNDDGAITDTFDVTIYDLLTPADVEPASLQAGAVGDISISLRTRKDLLVNDGFVAVLPEGFNIEGASLGSVTAGNAGFQLFVNPGTRTLVFRITSSSISAGTDISAIVHGVTNPALPGVTGSYQLRTQDTVSNDIYSYGTVPGDTLLSVNAPTVVNPIADQIVAAEDGNVTIEADLNDVFVDGDGDPLSFSIVAGHDTNLASVAITGAGDNALTVTGLQFGTTDVTVMADDMDDGSVTDTFRVSVYGLLQPAVVQPVSLVAGANGEVAVLLRNRVPLSVGDNFVVRWPDGFDHQSVTVNNVSPSGPSMSTHINATVTVLEITSGNFPANTDITITLGNVTNPLIPGQTGDFILETQDGSNGIYGQATLAGPVIEANNETPTISGPGNQIILEDSTTGELVVTIGDTEDDPDQLVLSAESSNTLVIPNDNIVLGGSGSARTITATPIADAYAQDITITLTVQDTELSEGQAQFDLTVTSVNDPPTFNPGMDVFVQEGSGAYLAPWAGLIDGGAPGEGGQNVTFNIASNDNPGLFAAGPEIGPNGTLGFTPANANGVANILVEAMDDGGNANGGDDTSDTVSLTITVTAAADLAIEKVSNSHFTQPNGTIVYVITATNHGPSDIMGAELVDIPPFRLGNIQWTCSGTRSGVCSTSGVGEIAEFVDLPSGSSVEFVVSADLMDADEIPVTNTASIVAPINVNELNTSNNSDGDTDLVGLFADSMETAEKD